MLQAFVLNTFVVLIAGGMALFAGLPLAVAGAPLLLPVVAILVGGQHALSILWRVLLPVIIGLTMILLYVWSHRIPWLKENFWSLPVNSSYGEQFFSVMATLYAVTTALILVKAIESFDKLSSAVVEEANRARSLGEFLSYFDDDGPSENVHIAAAIRATLVGYLEGARAEPKLGGGNGGAKYLDACARAVSRLQCVDENDRIALTEIIKGLNEMFSLRARRVGLAKSRMPRYLIIMLGVMSLAMTLMFFIEPPERPSHNFTMIFLLSVFSSFIIVLLQDINDPFDGFWTVDLSPYEEVRRFIEAESAKASSARVQTGRQPAELT